MFPFHIQCSWAAWLKLNSLTATRHFTVTKPNLIQFKFHSFYTFLFEYLATCFLKETLLGKHLTVFNKIHFSMASQASDQLQGQSALCHQISGVWKRQAELWLTALVSFSIPCSVTVALDGKNMGWNSRDRFSCFFFTMPQLISQKLPYYIKNSSTRNSAWILFAQ